MRKEKNGDSLKEVQPIVALLPREIRQIWKPSLRPVHMSRDITERLETFTKRELEFERIALNIDQVKEYNPPPNPAKLSDSRATVFRYLKQLYEEEAIIFNDGIYAPKPYNFGDFQ